MEKCLQKETKMAVLRLAWSISQFSFNFKRRQIARNNSKEPSTKVEFVLPEQFRDLDLVEDEEVVGGLRSGRKGGRVPLGE